MCVWSGRKKWDWEFFILKIQVQPNIFSRRICSCEKVKMAKAKEYRNQIVRQIKSGGMNGRHVFWERKLNNKKTKCGSNLSLTEVERVSDIAKYVLQWDKEIFSKIGIAFKINKKLSVRQIHKNVYDWFIESYEVPNWIEWLLTFPTF